MKKIFFAFVIFLSISASVAAQSIDENLLKDKYWVESIDSPSDKLLVFESKKAYTKNTNTPFVPSVFLFEQKNLTAIDSRWCAGLQTAGELKGSWKIKGDKIEFTLKDCANFFIIKELSENRMLIQIQ